MLSKNKKGNYIYAFYLLWFHKFISFRGVFLTGFIPDIYCLLLDRATDQLLVIQRNPNLLSLFL